MRQQVVNHRMNVVETFAPIDVASLNWVMQLKKGLFFKRLLTNEPFFLVEADEQALVLSLAKDHGHHVLWSVIVAETCL